jgi:hypothetical protein
LIIAHAREIVKHGIFKTSEWTEKHPCAQVKIGSFAPPPSAFNSAMAPLVTHLVGSLEQSLQNLSDCIREACGPQRGAENTQEKDSMLETESAPDDADSIESMIPADGAGSFKSLIPACNSALDSSRKLVQNLEECHAILADAGLLVLG